MKTGKNISLYNTLTKVTIIIIAFIVTLSSCSKQTSTSKLSSKSCYVLPSSVNMNGYFSCDGEPGFFVSSNETLNFGPGHDFITQSKFSWIGLNTINGHFSQSLIAFDPPLPKFTTRINSLTQLKPNSNSFILTSHYTFYDTAFIPHTYTKLYLTDKMLSSPKEFELTDSTLKIDQVIQMPDGRFAVSSTKTKGYAKDMNCYNSNLQFDWTKTADYTNTTITKSYTNVEILSTSNALYLLQTNNFIAKYYRVQQYDFNGKRNSIYEMNSNTNKFSAGQLIESPNGFYIVGTQYLPDKGDYDIHISTMSPANTLLSGHLWNLTDYLPDWNTAARNVRNTFLSGSSSHVIKTEKGYAYTIAYPDSKDKWSLALVMLNNEMKIESVKVLAKNVGSGISTLSSESLTIVNVENHLYIMWKQDQNNYFYVLDKEGNLIP